MSGRSIWWVSLGLVLGALGQAWGALPNGWSSQDIGTSGGSASEVNGMWAVSGDGADIWGGSDAFHFAYRRLNGDFEITARVVSNGSGSSTWSKGGVMIRETLTPGSKHAIMAITGGDGGGLTFQNRPTTGGVSYSSHDNPVASPPHWVRLRREGDTITGYSSINGVDWLQQPDGTSVDSTRNPVTIPMADEVYVGLAVTSHAAGEVRTYTFDNVSVGYAKTALEPDPENGAVHPDTWAVLSWLPGSTAHSHDVYFGGSFEDVSDGTGGTFRGNQSLADFTVGRPGTPYPDGLVRGTTYYWRIDEVEADGATKHKGNVWRFLVPSEKAFDPVPPDGAPFVTTGVTLTWTPGLGAQQHTVHFGDDFEAVANSQTGRTVSSPEFGRRNLEAGKTYYWRVDEFDGQTTHKGDVWSFATCPEELASATFYYVDASDPDARDSNPGTEGQPWKTIQKGAQSVRAGDILLIKAGTYREGVILDKSGTEANPIRIWAYPGHEGEVIINAAQPVTDWRRCTGSAECDGNPHWDHIYVADVAAWVNAHSASDFAIQQVFQHGEMLNRSRYPDAGWRYPITVTDPAGTFTDNTLTKPDGYFTGAVCHIKTALWQMDMIPITDFSWRAITLKRSPRYDISTQHGYYITSVVGEINEEGEWAFDPVEKKLYLWPKDDTPEDVEFTYRDYCIRTYGGVSWNIIRGLTMRYPYHDGAWLYQANHNTVEENTIEYAFRAGIMVQATNGQCANNRILNNTVKYSASRAINVDGNAAYNVIEGNYVYAVGTEHFGGDMINGQSFGIYVSGPFTQVYNNRIDRTGYTALYLDGSIYGRDISYNHITNVGLALSDGGGIYTGGYNERPEKDHIHHNLIEDAIGCLSMYRGHDVGLPMTIDRYSGDTPGIYVDEKGNNRVIEHNTVVGSHMAGVFFHWAPDNVVQNNTLYGNGVAQIYFSGRNQPRDKLVDDVVLDNILFATEVSQHTLYLAMNYDDVRFGQSDRNYFYHPYRTAHIHVHRYTGSWIDEDLTLWDWRLRSGYDHNSKEFSYLTQRSDMTVAYPRTSRIVTNPSLSPATIDLEGQTYYDVDGNEISGAVTLQPFESKVLISATFASAN